MNAKEVLGKIATLLSFNEGKEVQFTDARDAQGNILQSPTFDLGEDVSVVGEDGKLTPAPDGEHEIELTDSEGNKVTIRIETKDGKIQSRENVEESNPADLEKVDEEVVDKEAQTEEHLADATTVPAHALPNTTDEDPRNSLGEDTDETDFPIISELKARIAELELELEAYKMAEDTTIEEELPKLDGAPIEENMKKFSAVKRNQNKNVVGDPQNTFLSKLYK